jgi:hypothetical protein
MIEVNKKETDNHSADSQSKAQTQPAQRSLGLSVLLIFSFVYNGLLLIVLILGLFSTQVVQNILQQYYRQVYISSFTTFIFTLAGTLLFGVSFFGLILLWKMRRMGFYFYAAAQLILLISLVVLFRSYDYVNIAIALLALIIIGLHTKKMR